MMRAGRIGFGVAMVALGVICVVHGDFLWTWSGVPDGVPARQLLSIVVGIVLAVAGAGVALDRMLRPAALVIAAIWAAFALCHVPGFARDWRPYLGQLAEPTGLACLAAVLAGERGKARDQLAIAGRYGFGVCLVCYGAVHFLYPEAVASFIPEWIPARLFWAYATGAAFVAAALAVLSGVMIRLAALLLAAMFTGWVVLLHIPRVVAAASDIHEWATLGIAFAFMGGAWMFASSRATS